VVDFFYYSIPPILRQHTSRYSVFTYLPIYFIKIVHNDLFKLQTCFEIDFSLKYVILINITIILCVYCD